MKLCRCWARMRGAVSDHCLFLQLSGERLTFRTHHCTTGELIAGCRIRGPFRLRVGPAAAAIPQRKGGDDRDCR